MSSLEATDRTRVKRGAKRASYDRDSAYALIDATVLCHLAHLEQGQVAVTPTCHWRDGDYLYWHAHRMARNVASRGHESIAINICVLDGLVMARSAFHHSINYRSLTLFGVPEVITDEAEKERHLRLFMDKLSPGRWEQLRPVHSQEVAATGVARLAIEEASLKIRNGPPNDDATDIDWPVWAGVIPRQGQWQSPRQEADSQPGLQPPRLGIDAP